MFRIINFIILILGSNFHFNNNNNFENVNSTSDLNEHISNITHDENKYLENKNVLNDLLCEWIEIFIVKIKPHYELYTYMRDPYNFSIIYLFIYNIIDKEINYYEINFLDINQSNDILYKLYRNISNNDAQFLSALTENRKICSTFISSNKRTYSFTSLFPMFFKYLCKDLKINLNILYKKKSQLSKPHMKIIELKTFYQYFFFNLKFIKNYIEKCEDIILSENVKNNIFYRKNVVILKIDYLKHYISKWRTKVYKFNSLTKIKKLDLIIKLSKDLNTYNLQKGITRVYVAKMAFKEILKIEDKLDKYSFFIVFLLLYSKRNDRYNDTNMCNFTSLILTYNIMKYYNDELKFDYTYLLFKICDKRILLEELQNKSINIFSSYKTSSTEMKYIIVNRYLLTIMKLDGGNMINLIDFKKNEKEFNLFCDLILLTIKLKFKIFGFEF